MGRVAKTAMTMLLFSVIGGVLALIEYSLYEREILVNVFIDADVTLYAVMFFTVFICELVGVIVSATD